MTSLSARLRFSLGFTYLLLAVFLMACGGKESSEQRRSTPSEADPSGLSLVPRAPAHGPAPSTQMQRGEGLTLKSVTSPGRRGNTARVTVGRGPMRSYRKYSHATDP